MRDTSAVPSLALSVADKKNSELHLLTGLVTQAQFDVDEKQAIVASLQAKSQQFAQYLAQADQDQQQALANLDMGKEALASAASLATSMKMASAKTADATAGAAGVSSGVATLIHKLILSVEFINKVSQLVNKQKSNNPLVPDPLIQHMSKACTAANNAIALTLTALQSCYVAEATLLESSNVLVLGTQQSKELSDRMKNAWNAQSGKVTPPPADATPAPGAIGIVGLLQQAYGAAKDRYNQALTNNNIVTKQLSHAQSQLDSATVQLNSYQSGLAAAKAAAYAA